MMGGIKNFWIILLVLACISGLKLNGQTSSISDPNKSWIYTHSQSTHSFYQSYRSTYEVFFAADTLINDSTFRPLYKRVLKYYASGPYANADTVYPYPSTPWLDQLYYEDENAIYQRMEDGSLKLKWDYTVVPGDTLRWYDNFFGDHLEFIIDSITPFSDDIPNRRYWFSVSANTFYGVGENGGYASFTEGIGITGYDGAGPLFNYNLMGPDINELFNTNCIVEKGIYLLGNNCHPAFVGIQEKERALPLQVFPNPVTDGEINLNLPFDGTLSIYGFNGANLITQEATAGVLALSTKKWPRGLYQVVFTTDQGQKYVAKVVK